MAHLTDAQHKTVGHTVLYVPDEGFRMEDRLAHLDKDLVQRLEGEKQVGQLFFAVIVVTLKSQSVLNMS